MRSRLLIILCLLGLPLVCRADTSGSDALGAAASSPSGVSTMLSNILQPNGTQSLQSNPNSSIQDYQGTGAQTLQGSLPSTQDLSVLGAQSDGAPQTLNANHTSTDLAVGITLLLVVIAAATAYRWQPTEQLVEPDPSTLDSA